MIQLPRGRDDASAKLALAHDEGDEQALLAALLDQTTIARMQTTPFLAVSPAATVEQVVALMTERRIAAVIVAEAGELQGIFTERDVLNRVADIWQEVRLSPVREVMTPNPLYLLESDSVATALGAIAEFGYRHFPVLDQQGHVVGIISPQRVLRFFGQHWCE